MNGPGESGKGDIDMVELCPIFGLLDEIQLNSSPK
jgi:hypothetical protein